MATDRQRAHMQKMRKILAAKRARAAQTAIDADNPIDDTVSVDDVMPAQATSQGPVKRSPGRPRKPSVPQPQADYEPPAPRLRRQIDSEIEARAAKVGVGNRPQHRTPVNPTIRRDITRDQHTGRIVVERGGKLYTRRHTNVGDKFHIDAADIPDGMSYQWIAVTVAGAEQRNSLAQFQQNGWESVPMSRYPGRYGPEKADGKVNHNPIIIDGLMLCERPIELTIEAREEEIAAARQLIRTRNEQFSPKLPGALDRGRRGTGLRASRTIEGMPPEIGRPNYEVAVDEGLV